MIPTFADALSNLLSQYQDEDIEVVISELELQLFALRETASQDEDDNGDDE